MLADLAEKRRSKEVKLNSLSSISGGGGSGGKPTGRKNERECYSCGEMGHEKRDCPRPQSSKRKSNIDSNGNPRPSRETLKR